MTSHPSLSDLLPVDTPSGDILPRHPADSQLNSIGCNHNPHMGPDIVFQSNTCDSVCAVFQTLVSLCLPFLSPPPPLVWGHNCMACREGSPPPLWIFLQPPGVDLSPGWRQQRPCHKFQMWVVEQMMLSLHLDFYDSLRQECDDPLLPFDLQWGSWHIVCGGLLACVKDEWGIHSSGLCQCHQGIPEENRNSGACEKHTDDRLLLSNSVRLSY